MKKSSNISVRKATVPYNRAKGYEKTVTKFVTDRIDTLDLVERSKDDLNVHRGCFDFDTLTKLGGNVRYKNSRLFITHPTPDVVRVAYIGEKPSIV